MRRAGAGLLLALAAACISERSDPTGAVVLDCSLPLDTASVGRIGVVAIRDFAFHPAELRVPRGTPVTWLNCEPAEQVQPHTATADDAAFESGVLAPGDRFTVRLNAPGTYDYHCAPHPFMRARIIVE